MKKNNPLITSLSKDLFWDADKLTIDAGRHSKFIVSRVLLYGFYSDWEKIKDYYGLNKVVDIATDLKELDKKTVAFLALLSGIKKNRFKCYTTEQSNLIHWNF